ncbi:MAG: response regulator, partial [Opitutaceae bacterium]
SAVSDARATEPSWPEPAAACRSVCGIAEGENRAEASEANRKTLFGFSAWGSAVSLCRMSDGPDRTDAPAPLPPKAAVLLIDDEQGLLDVFAVALSPYFDVTTATSTREAEFILRKKTFKVVVADHLMPGGNGMSFLVRAREEYPHMQRVLVTGYMKPEMLLRSVNEAALFRYLLKPVAINELIAVVQDAAKAHDASQAAG